MGQINQFVIKQLIGNFCLSFLFILVVDGKAQLNIPGHLNLRGHHRNKWRRPSMPLPSTVMSAPNTIWNSPTQNPILTSNYDPISTDPSKNDSPNWPTRPRVKTQKWSKPDEPNWNQFNPIKNPQFNYNSQRSTKPSSSSWGQSTRHRVESKSKNYGQGQSTAASQPNWNIRSSSLGQSQRQGQEKEPQWNVPSSASASTKVNTFGPPKWNKVNPNSRVSVGQYDYDEGQVSYSYHDDDDSGDEWSGRSQGQSYEPLNRPPQKLFSHPATFHDDTTSDKLSYSTLPYGGTSGGRGSGSGGKYASMAPPPKNSNNFYYSPSLTTSSDDFSHDLRSPPKSQGGQNNFGYQVTDIYESGIEIPTHNLRANLNKGYKESFNTKNVKNNYKDERDFYANSYKNHDDKKVNYEKSPKQIPNYQYNDNYNYNDNRNDARDHYDYTKTNDYHGKYNYQNSNKNVNGNLNYRPGKMNPNFEVEDPFMEIAQTQFKNGGNDNGGSSNKNRGSHMTIPMTIPMPSENYYSQKEKEMEGEAMVTQSAGQWGQKPSRSIIEINLSRILPDLRPMCSFLFKHMDFEESLCRNKKTSPF